ncbi:hypothetical protein Mjas_01500 [Methanothermococcus sp. Ax23]|uniref:hypothetical protein n=1 Tax=Methanothermococcus sp. Ax23 TaxID=3156486 RepID=UPI003BA13369
MLKRLVLILIIMAVPIGVSAKNITLIDAQTGEQKVFWINDTDENLPENLTVQIIKKLEIEGNKTVIVYDANMVKAYNVLIAELQKNMTKLQNELDKKNKLLAEYISYKKKNIELNKNITNLQKQITTLKAENEIIKQQNEQYKDIITDLINKQSNETKEDYISAYNEWKKDVSNFKTAVIFGGLACIVIGYGFVRYKKRYDYPV